MEKTPRKDPSVLNYDPVRFPTWVWILILGAIFLLFGLGVYYSTKPLDLPSVSSKQWENSRGILGTPGFE
jgi:hypothetical protein